MAKAEEKKELEKKPEEGTGIIENDKPFEAAGDDDAHDEEEVQVKDAAEEFKKQIEALKRSEQEQRQAREQAEAERAKALALVQERELALGHQQVSAAQHRFEAITAAMGAAQTAAEAAQRDIEVAINNGDAAAQAEAYRRLSRAEADLSRLEEGKNAAEDEIRAEKERVAQAQQAAKAAAAAAANDPLARANIPEAAKTWLRAHPEYLSDPRKNSKLQSLHWDVMDEGHPAFSPEYFDSIERKLGLKAAAEKIEEDEEQPAKRTNVSAPVSRQVPGSTPPRSTAATLTKAEREIAKAAGITEVEYAKQKQALQDAKAAGHYSN